MNKVQKILVILALAAAVGAPLLPLSRGQQLTMSAGKIPIQNNGRVKSLAVFAQETVRLITGKGQWEGQTPVEFVLNFATQPDENSAKRCIRIDLPELKRQLNLPVERTFFSYGELKNVFSILSGLLQQAEDKQQKDQHLSKLEQEAQTLYTRIETVDRLKSGELLAVVPPMTGEAWKSPAEHPGDLAVRFKDLLNNYAQGKTADFQASVEKWMTDVTSSMPSLRHKMNLEVMYITLRPFHAAWIFYLLSFVLLSFFPRNALLAFAGRIMAVLGFACHSGGLIFRVLILSRPPVSNMYESMIFMNWVLMVFAGIFYLAKKKDFFLTTGALISALIMIYADLLPISQGLDVLTPVLRSNYWLTVHVLTIVSSYGIFGFTMALGHRHLFLDVQGQLTREAEADSAYILMRLMQAGLLALGVGTVLGGVWANESWGRFWGWDPKETWALITFLGYMAVLHLRYAKKLGNFALAVSAVVAFLLVMMTWYGVNFVLGKGLHSYGTGSGGVIWIILYLLIESCFLVYVFVKKFTRVDRHPVKTS